MMQPRYTVSAICAALVLSLAAPLQCLAQAAPRVFLYDPAMLVRLKNADAGDAQKQQVFLAAKTAADKALHEGPFSVVQKGITPPSGDKHDYMSQAPYFWADPSKADGLPYIRRDGQRNPELKKISDHDQFGKMGDDARVLALEYYLTGGEEYANRAALLLRTWFLDPATKMNPNLEFGQGIPGINTGRGIGIIESRSLLGACEAVGLLAGSKTWTVSDEQGIKTWMAAYLSWMRNSQKGKDEDAARNNHGTWYDLQVTELALYLGDRKLAVDTLERVKTRRITQIDPDGRQPLETARTNGWGYSNGNLDGLTQLATLGERVGVDLWNYKTPDGRSIRGAIDFLLPYAVAGKKWEYQQIGGFKASDLEHSLERAAIAYHDAKYAAAAKQVRDRDDLATVMPASD
jgi:Alginate lyase